MDTVGLIDSLQFRLVGEYAALYHINLVFDIFLIKSGNTVVQGDEFCVLPLIFKYDMIAEISFVVAPIESGYPCFSVVLLYRELVLGGFLRQCLCVVTAP